MKISKKKREFNVIIDFFGEIEFLFFMLNLFVMHLFVKHYLHINI